MALGIAEMKEPHTAWLSQLSTTTGYWPIGP
jgi:hypothetical protein